MAARSQNDIAKLRELGHLLIQNINIVTQEWSKEETDEPTADNGEKLPTQRLHQAQRTLLAASGTLNEMVISPLTRLQEIAAQFWETRSLAVAVERRIPELLHEAGEKGLDIDTLSAKTGIESRKLSRILRCLCSNHIFAQTETGNFANNRITTPLVNNDEFRAYLTIFFLDVYAVSEKLPKYLVGPKGSSYDVSETPFQEAVGTDKPRWDWLAEKVKPEDITHDGPGYSGVPDPKKWSHLKPDENGLIARPELENFSLAMVGGGKSNGFAIPFDYPWDKLPNGATVVDVGGGVGGFIYQLLAAHPHFHCVVQDRAEVIETAQKTFWPQNGQKFLDSGNVKLQPLDFFKANPVKGADVYFLRGILHDWADDYCVRILSAVKESMTESSRILICDQVMNTTHGCEELESAPWPLPANYGYNQRYHHQRDLTMMSLINGIERTPQQFKALCDGAGLRLTNIYETRNVFSIVEIRL